jgi:hypothetical protein
MKQATPAWKLLYSTEKERVENSYMMSVLVSYLLQWQIPETTWKEEKFIWVQFIAEVLVHEHLTLLLWACDPSHPGGQEGKE